MKILVWFLEHQHNVSAVYTKNVYIVIIWLRKIEVSNL